MSFLSARWMKPGLIGLAVVGCLLVVAFVVTRTGVVSAWFNSTKHEKGDSPEGESAAELVRSPDGKPARPFALRITPEAAKSLDITARTIVVAKAPDKLRALPPMLGTLAFENDRMYKITSRFAGELDELPIAPTDRRLDTEIGTPRPYAVGDRVKKGDLLAVVRSPALGDKKAALVDALIDKKRDEAYYEDLKRLYTEGAASKKDEEDARRMVQKDINAVRSAKRTLQTWKVSDEEIAALEREAHGANGKMHDAEREKEWARVEVKAPKDGTIVEKNYHVGDWVDPANYNTPMYRIANLDELSVWIKPAEEYLPILQNFLNRHDDEPLKWDILLQSDSKARPLKGNLIRIGPSLDVNERTPVLFGVVNNPGHRLLVGQLVITTIYVPFEKALVEIPTTALNEQKGQSVVFVQPDPGKLEFRIKAVSVVYRFKDVVYIRSQLPEQPPHSVQTGALPIEPLEPGERVVTESVIELTNALRDLLAKSEPAAEE